MSELKPTTAPAYVVCDLCGGCSEDADLALVHHPSGNNSWRCRPCREDPCPPEEEDEVHCVKCGAVLDYGDPNCGLGTCPSCLGMQNKENTE